MNITNVTKYEQPDTLWIFLGCASLAISLGLLLYLIFQS